MGAYVNLAEGDANIIKVGRRRFKNNNIGEGVNWSTFYLGGGKGSDLN